MTWTVDIPGGTDVYVDIHACRASLTIIPSTFALKDSTGNTAYTDTVNIQKGNDAS